MSQATMPTAENPNTRTWQKFIFPVLAILVAAALLVLGWQGMGWLPLALVTVVALLLLLAGTGLLAARAQRLTRAARGHRDD